MLFLGALLAHDRVCSVVERVQAELDVAVNSSSTHAAPCVVDCSELSTVPGRRALRTCLAEARHCVVRLAPQDGLRLKAAKRTAAAWLSDPACLADVGPARPVSADRPSEFVGVFAGPFVELRIDDTGLVPRSDDHLDDAKHVLGTLARQVLDTLDCPMHLVDDPLCERSSISTTVMRLCSYDTTATFGAHTDTSFLTLIPCANTPGLDVFDGEAWRRPEAHADPETDVLVLPGELLELASNAKFRAAVHRVVVRAPRVSMPMLLRGARAASFDDRLPMPAVWTALQADSPQEARRRLLEVTS